MLVLTYCIVITYLREALDLSKLEEVHRYHQQGLNVAYDIDLHAKWEDRSVECK